MSSPNRLTLVSIVLALSVSAILVLTAYVYVKPSTPPPELQGVLRPEFRLLQPVELVDHDSIPFSDKSFVGKWSILFFGYLSCPDVCPTTLHVLNSVQRRLKEEVRGAGTEVQVVFVSVDPARDSLENIDEYIHFFNKDFIGVTGVKAEVDNLASQFGAGYFLGEVNASGQYEVAHTSAIFLVDPRSRLVASFSQPHYAETISTQFLKIVGYLENG